MKTAVKGLGDIETPENNPHLKHYLSPLALAAYRHNFQKFTYQTKAGSSGKPLSSNST